MSRKIKIGLIILMIILSSLACNWESPGNDPTCYPPIPGIAPCQ